MYRIIGGDRQEYGPVSADELRRWIAEGRADGKTVAQIEGGQWKPLSEFPEFADALPVSTTPAPPALPPLPAVTGPGRPPATAAQKVQAPGACLVAVGVLGVFQYVVGMVMSAFGVQPGLTETTGNPDLDRIFEFLSGPAGFTFDLVGIGLSVLVIFGGLQMMKLKGYGLAMAAAIISVFPCTSPCCCVGLPLGIWALVVLVNPEIKSAFFDTSLRA